MTRNHFLLVVAGVWAAGSLFMGQAQVVNSAAPLATVQPGTVPIPLGPTLDVLPHVSADGYTIQMNLIPTVTEFLGYEETAYTAQVGNINNLPPYPLPHFRVRQITTTAIVWDGQTIMLGGLIAERVQKRKDKVPILGDLPLVGALFRSEGSMSTKANLVIFVTPTIIDPAGNRIHGEDNLPYDPNKVPAQVPFAPK